MMFLADIIFDQLPVFVVKFKRVGRWPDHTAAWIGNLVSIRHDHLWVVAVNVLA